MTRPCSTVATPSRPIATSRSVLAERLRNAGREARVPLSGCSTSTGAVFEDLDLYEAGETEPTMEELKRGQAVRGEPGLSQRYARPSWGFL